MNALLIDAERAVLGGLVTGVLALRDVDDVGEGMTAELHREIFCVLAAALEARTAGAAIPGRRGIDLAWACRACKLCGVWPAGATYASSPDGRHYTIGYLPTIARAAPGRKAALAACALLRAESERAWNVARDREVIAAAFVETIGDLADSFRRRIVEDGGISHRGDPERCLAGWVRPVDAKALPPAHALQLWLGATLISDALRSRDATPSAVAGLDVRVVMLPDGSDPDAFVRERGVEALRRLLGTAA